MIGIYKIINQINGKIYIGQSINIKERWKEHKNIAFNPNNKNYDIYLYRAIRKYGLENFSFEVIEECNQEELDQKEIYWISFYDSTNKEKGYNCSMGGGGYKLYNYEKIYNKWKEGFTCKELQSLFGCSDWVITSALQTYCVNEIEIKARGQKNTIKKYVALSKDNIPLKIFYGMQSISVFFTGEKYKIDNISQVIEKHYSRFGYYWDYLNENNIPEKELTDEEFLSYQMSNLYHWSKEEKRKISERQRIVKRPSREELKHLIRTKPFTQIGKMYGVSDTAISKWCQFENLPMRKRDINKYTDEEWELI